MIDEVNRALHGEKPSGYVTPVFVVTKNNSSIEGGADGWFVPSNGYKEHYLAIWKGDE